MSPLLCVMLKILAAIFGVSNNIECETDSSPEELLLPAVRPVPENKTTPTTAVDPGSANNSSSSSGFIQFTRAIKAINMTKIGDDIDQNTADIIRYNFGIDNEDKYFNSTQLITKCGYPVEEYTVETRDGYLLQVFRIPGAGPAVYIMHGFLVSSDDFMTSGCEKSLAFVVFNAGYDVWLGNARGNKYSRRHATLNPDIDRTFWDFSWHQIAVIDVPAIIDFILETTGRKRLFYVAHSQGTTAAYVLLSERPEYNDKVALAVTMSPIAWLGHAFSPLLRVMSQFAGDMTLMESALGAGEFMPSYQLLGLLQLATCGSSVTAFLLCNPLLSSMFGFNPSQVNFTLYPVQSNHLPAGASSKQLVHFMQLMKSARFRQFDYGEEQNTAKYGRPTPPDYDVTKITSPVAIFCSDNDWVSSLIDINILASKLPNVQFYHKVPLPYNHLDFLWGKNAHEVVYLKIIELLKVY